MKKSILLALSAILVSFLIFGGFLNVSQTSAASPQTTPAQKIVLKAISAFPVTALECDPARIVHKRFNEAFKGQLEINWLGGPEAIASFDQMDALRRGTVDMILHTPYGYAQALMPEANFAGLSPYAPWEEREIGSFALWQELFKKRVNAYLLGRLDGYATYNIFCNPKITKLADFKGLTMRAYPLYIPFLRALGMTAQTIPASEMYTAMEQGVVDGFMWPRWGANSYGMHEVTKYRIDPGILQGDGACLVNLDKWNKIPQDLQEKMENEIQKIEGITVSRKLVFCMREEGIMKKAGMQMIALPPEEADKFVKIGYDATWESLMKDAPEYGAKFKEIWDKAQDKIKPIGLR